MTTQRSADELQRGPPGMHQPPRILLAEDDADLRGVIAGALHGVGYRVTEARTGAQLLDHLADALLSNNRAARPDVIVSDIRMPGFTGLEVLAGLRDAGWHTAMVVITAYADPETRARVKEMGADAFFEKPFHLDELLTAVRNVSPPWRRARWRS